MKNLLMVAYYFPPLGGGGVQRTVKFAKYLPDFGWRPTVLTVKDVRYRSYDATPLEDLIDCAVVRSGSFDPFRLMFIFRRGFPERSTGFGSRGGRRSFAELEGSSGGAGGLTRVYAFFAWISKYLLIPDIEILWAPFALLKGVRMCRPGDFDAIYTTSPPESAHLIGWAMKKITGLPWVADFRDVWSGLYWRRRLPFFNRLANRTLEAAVMRSADGLVMNTGPSLKYVRSSVGPEKPATVITNGFDPADFDGASAERNDDDYVIVHLGNFGAGITAKTLLCGFAAARERDAGFGERAKLYFIGVNSASDIALAEKLGLSRKVFFAGYAPYREGLTFARAADLLLLVMGPYSEEERVPGKFYEYVGAGKPLFAVVPAGETERLARELYDGFYLARPNDTAGIADGFLAAFERWASRGSPYAPDPSRASSYERRKLAGDLAGFIDSIVENYQEKRNVL